MEIHSTAIVNPQARLAENVVIGPYTIIGPNVTIGADTVMGPHVVIDGWTQIGARNEICPFTTIGYPPQDVNYKGEPTQVIIGDDNIIRENVTIHRGTQEGRSVTTVGNNNMLMAYAHVAHDCIIGNHVIIANAYLAGHVQVDDHASVSGMVVVHQFVRIGAYAFIGGKAGIGKDVPPYMLAAGERGKLYGLNLVGLKRHNFSPESILALKRSYRILFRMDLTLEKAIDKVREEVEQTPEVENLLNFVGGSKRGITR
jgi:UDP-N-acetylglucosamine acyltransferase